MSNNFNPDEWGMSTKDDHPLEQSEFKNKRDKIIGEVVNKADEIKKTAKEGELIKKDTRLAIGYTYRFVIGSILIGVTVVYLIANNFDLIDMVEEYPISVITFVSALPLLFIRRNWAFFVSMTILAVSFFVFALLMLFGVYSVHGNVF